MPKGVERPFPYKIEPGQYSVNDFIRIPDKPKSDHWLISKLRYAMGKLPHTSRF